MPSLKAKISIRHREKQILKSETGTYFDGIFNIYIFIKYCLDKNPRKCINRKLNYFNDRLDSKRSNTLMTLFKSSAKLFLHIWEIFPWILEQLKKSLRIPKRNIIKKPTRDVNAFKLRLGASYSNYTVKKSIYFISFYLTWLLYPFGSNK